MNAGKSDVKSMKCWNHNTTNKLMEKCMNVIFMNKKHTRTEARRTENKFVEFTIYPYKESQYRETVSLSPFIVETIINKCLGTPCQLEDSLRKDTCNNDHIRLSLN